jgi:hypothetical protein
VGLATIGLIAGIGQGVMGIANGFAQANLAQQQARVNTAVAQNNYAVQKNAIVQQENQQAVATTGQQSSQIATANRNLATVAAVMGERGMSAATFTGMANDIGNSASLDLSRTGINYDNMMATDSARIEAAGQDYENVKANAANTASAASNSAWLNAFGTTLQIGGQYIGKQMDLTQMQKMLNDRTIWKGDPAGYLAMGM